MPLPDVLNTLKLFEESLANGMPVQPGALDLSLLVWADEPNGKIRMSYAYVAGAKVVAFVQFIAIGIHEGVPLFHAGWAVAEAYQGQGRARDIVLAALKEMRHGYRRAGLPSFYVEAAVALDNIASQKVAEKVLLAPLSTQADDITDEPILHYRRRIDAKTEL